MRAPRPRTRAHAHRDTPARRADHVFFPFAATAWLNKEHFEQLKANNALSADLERQIGAFQVLKQAETAQ